MTISRTFASPILCIALLAAPLVACACGPHPPPYTTAAGTYADATKASADAIAGTPSEMSRSCWKLADVSYLQSRLDRVKVGNEMAPPPVSLVPFAEWRDKAEAFPKVTWTSYCSQLNASA